MSVAALFYNARCHCYICVVIYSTPRHSSSVDSHTPARACARIVSCTRVCIFLSIRSILTSLSTISFNKYSSSSSMFSFKQDFLLTCSLNMVGISYCKISIISSISYILHQRVVFCFLVVQISTNFLSTKNSIASERRVFPTSSILLAGCYSFRILYVCSYVAYMHLLFPSYFPVVDMLFYVTLPRPFLII